MKKPQVGQQVDFYPDDARRRAHGPGPHPAHVTGLVSDEAVSLEVFYPGTDKSERLGMVHHDRPGICWRYPPANSPDPAPPPEPSRAAPDFPARTQPVEREAEQEPAAKPRNKGGRPKGSKTKKGGKGLSLLERARKAGTEG